MQLPDTRMDLDLAQPSSYSCTADYAPGTVPIFHNNLFLWHSSQQECCGIAGRCNLLLVWLPLDQQSKPCRGMGYWHCRGFPNTTTFKINTPHAWVFTKYNELFL